MGPGVPHTVVSLRRAGCEHVPAVMLGSHCLSWFTMHETLRSAIKHAFWHDVWTNALHDDRDFLIARMLVWQVAHMEAGAPWPCTGKNLHALLVMGIIPRLLLSLPFSIRAGSEWLHHYDPLNDPPFLPTPSDTFLATIREKMSQVARLIMKKLPGPELEGFQLFWVKERALFIEEFQCRSKYNNEQN